MTASGQFAGQVVLVTGGTKGLGRAICAAFADAGATVVTCARRPADEPDPRVEFAACDVRDAAAVEALIAGITERHGRLDVVVNNAGGTPFVPVAGSSPRIHQSILNLNLVAPLLVSMYAQPVMEAQPTGGVILNVSSLSGSRPSKGSAAYGAAKAGLESLTASLAAEWAPKVRVNCVVVGLLVTEQAELHYGDAEAIERINRVVPMGRMANPDDLTPVFLFLASPGAAYVTGACVPVHGGGELPAFLLLSDNAPGV